MASGPGQLPGRQRSRRCGWELRGRWAAAGSGICGSGHCIKCAGCFSHACFSRDMRWRVWCKQVNKNWLAKVLVGTDAMVAALAFKAWWQPSFTVAANAGAARGCHVRLRLPSSRQVSEFAV